jgi:signal transduction histidine kinase
MLFKQWFPRIQLSISPSFTDWYISLLVLSLFLTIVDSVVVYAIYPRITPVWLYVTSSIAYLIALTGSLITIIISFRKSNLREREQLRFFVTGVILALTPLLLLTVIPQIIPMLSPYAIDAQITTLTVILLPLSLGYSILRYQILVFDSYIRLTVNWIIGVIFLAILAYAVYLLGILLEETQLLSFMTGVVIIVTSIVFAPFTWWLAKMLTGRVLFKESLRSRLLIDAPIKVGNEALDLENVGQLITEAALQTFKTTQVSLFILIEDTGCYHIFPHLQDEQTDDPRRTLVTRLASSLPTTFDTDSDVLALQPSVEERLFESRRPLLLHEVMRAEEDMPTGLSRYFTSSSPDEQNVPLIAPVRSQGKMIALLVLGERADQQSYAGPDFEIVELLLARYSSLLNTARLQARSRHHAALLNDLYKTGAINPGESPDLESVASAFAKIAADATGAGVEIYLYDEKEQLLRQTARVGVGPQLLSSNTIPLTLEDWQSYYYAGKRAYPLTSGSTDTPPCLRQKPQSPFAWLPLKKGEKHLGILILTYPRPHLFFEEEIYVLEMFAEQCAANIENTRITIELRAAYERQKELDVLKDQFIMTTSHELRTPLTAVVGYLELLREYNGTLGADARADFIAKAHRGCDELTLMVNNIMDVNHVQIDIDNTKMTPVSLEESVMHIVEIVESLSSREQRTISVTISPTLFVMADAIRLRQVLLNLVSNALKYSPHGTPIEISAKTEHNSVTVCVRDYGSGVPLEEQNRLFERFVRLERDMNSPIRGAGLGLYISKQLLEAMNGTIWIQSTGQAGEGSSFCFTVQLAPSLLHTNTSEQQNLSALA